MTELKLSEAEKCYLISGINDDFRTDGRQCLDRQEIDIDIDLVPSCAGSAQVRSGNSQVLVGIKMNLEKPLFEEPKKGKIEFFVDISANASPFFEGKGGQNISNEIKSLFDHSFLDCQFLNELCIIEGQTVWCIFVDILILETGSKPSLCDACSVAVFAALYSTKYCTV
jgi:PREDICTED: similar to exosome complex exonuclease RRP42